MARIWRLLSAAIVLLTTLVVAGGTASAAELKESSWWWRGNTGPAPVPPPTAVAPGGLMVTGTPDGASAIAALHFVLGEGESTPSLTLTVADNGDQGGAQAVMAACLAGSAWAGSEQGGPWESKPNVACQAGSVQGVRAEDGKTWTFALAPLVVGRDVNIVITPGTIAPGAPVGSTFSLTFNPPSSTSLATTPGSSASSSLTPDAAAALPTADSQSSIAVPSVDLGTSTAAPIDLGAPLPAASAFTPSLPESSQGLTATAPLLRERTAANVPQPTDGGRGSAAAVLVLLAGIAIAVRLYRLPTPAPRRLGPLASAIPRVPAVAVATADASPGGLGRFARPRSGAPPPLI